MRIGILCEGEKSDVPVLHALLGHLFENITFEIRGVSKEVIFSIGDLELQSLFDKGVERALVIWDLLPTIRVCPKIDCNLKAIVTSAR